MLGKGLLGQYAGFVSRAVGFILDLLIVIAIIWVVNFAITLPLRFFLDFNVNQCNVQSITSLQLLGEDRQILCVVVIATQATMSLLAGPVYFILLWALGGQTIGQYMAGVRVVRLDGRRMNFKSSLIRYVGYFVSILALGLGFFWVLWDDRRQGFHDKMAKTVVVYAWTARQNEFLLDRVRQKLTPRPEATRSTLDPEELRDLRFLIVSFHQHAVMNGALSSLEESVRRGDFNVINVVVLVKDESGHLGLVGVSDLSMNTATQPTLLIDIDFRDIRAGLEALLQDYPAESFVMAILVRRETERRLASALERLNLTPQTVTMGKVLATVNESRSLAQVASDPAGSAELQA